MSPEKLDMQCDIEGGYIPMYIYVLGLIAPVAFVERKEKRGEIGSGVIELYITNNPTRKGVARV